MTVAGCDNGTYDGMLAVYDNGMGDCACPPWGEMFTFACNDDGCGEPNGMPSIVDLSIWGYGCYLIRVGGRYGDQGSGQLYIKVVWDYRRPMPEDCATISPGDRCSSSGTCVTDADCHGESMCVPPPLLQPEWGSVCYAPKTRYLSIARHPDQLWGTARRVKLSSGELLGWVGEPYEVDGLWVADIVDSPYYEEQWPDVVHVTGCAVAHAGLCDDGDHCMPNGCPSGRDCVHHGYRIQAIIVGESIQDESNYSEVLMLCTNSTWGDTVSSCGGNVCKPPNGLPGLDDIMAAINYFMGSTAIAPITWLDIDPSNLAQCPEQIVGLGDIMAAIAGFQGHVYPGNGPLNCP